jgi:processive 1,2-diacylglycerol beta-glucosyltransferase
VDTDSTRDKVCPQCQAKYKWYESECVECRVPLVDGPEEPDVSLVPVFSAADGALMPLAKLALEKEQIEYIVRKTPPPLPGLRRAIRVTDLDVPGEILVRAGDAARARDLLVDLEQATPVEPAPELPHPAAAPAAPSEPATIVLHDCATGALVGRITERQLQFLIDGLEEATEDGRDYYIDPATLEMFESEQADPALVEVLRGALAGREGLDIRWSRA